MQIANFLKIGSKNYFSRQHGSFLLIYFHRQKMDSRHSDHFITKRMILELPRADRWAIQTDCDWIQSDCKELKNSLNWRKWKPPVKDREQPTRRVIFGNAEPLWSVLQKMNVNRIYVRKWKLLVPKKLKNYEYSKKMNLLELVLDMDRIGLSHGEAVW